MIADSVTEAFASLFQGRTDVWGALRGQAIKESVTLAHYRNHLAGNVSLGIYPLRPDGRIRWCAVDVDIQDSAPSLRVLAALCSLGLRQGVYLERSKSKGFHIIIILSDWAQAAHVRRMAKAALRDAGLPQTTEVFPKQDRLTTDTPWGNYLNLPYFGSDNPEGRRMVVDPNSLTPLPLQVWLDQVEPFPVDALPPIVEVLPGKLGVTQRQGHSKAELLNKLSGNHELGARRPTLVSLAGYLRCRGIAEDVAVMFLLPWASQHCNPPLPEAEIKKHIRGIYSRYGLGKPETRSPVNADAVISLDNAPPDIQEALSEVWR